MNTDRKSADRRRLEKLLVTASKLVDQLDDAERRGLVGDWRIGGGRKLRDDLAEFHDWQARKLS